MTIWHLKLFVAVAETGSMSAAAAKYFIKQPSVSQKISELETHYGVLLFERLGNRLHITESGQKLLELARDLTSRFDFLEEYMQSEQRSRRIRIGATVTIGSSVFPQIIQQFRERSPGTEVYACVQNTAAIADKLLKNELDIALVEGKVKNQDLISIPKIKDFLVLACGKGHPFYGRSALHVAELNGMEFVMREPGSGTRELFEGFAAERGIHIKTVFEYNNPEAMRNAICINNCLAVISVRLLEQAAQTGDVHLFIRSEQEWNRTFNLVFHKNKHINPSMREFCSLLERFQDVQMEEKYPMGQLL